VQIRFYAKNQLGECHFVFIYRKLYMQYVKYFTKNSKQRGIANQFRAKV